MSETQIPDYSAYFDEKLKEPGGNLIVALTALADQYEEAAKEVERLDALYSEAKKNLQRISEVDIPNLMDGLEGKIVLPDKRTITINEKIRSSATGDRKLPAIKWLEENGHGAIIKRQFIIEFGKDQEKQATKFANDLAKRKNPLNVKKEISIHHSTLEAFIRESLGNGEAVPLDIFGVYRQKSTKIKEAPTE